MTESFFRQLHQEYKEGISVRELGIKYEKSEPTIRGGFARYKLPMRPTKPASLVNDYFDCIDSEVKAYLLGFHLGDGGISIRPSPRNEYVLRVTVSSSDTWILNLFRDQIQPDRAITSHIPPDIHANGKTYRCKEASSIAFYSKQLVEAVCRFGYGVRKTTSEKYLPTIPAELMRHFIRGYFDADGSCVNCLISRPERPVGDRAKSVWHIPSYDRVILEDIKSLLDKELGINLRIYDYKTKKVHYLKSSKLEEIHKLYHYFYDGATYYFERKKKKFETTMLTPRELRELKVSQPRNA